MKKNYLLIGVFILLIQCFFHSDSYAGKPLTPYPSYDRVVYHFFTAYSLRNVSYHYGNLVFIKNKEGYSVNLPEYDTATIKYTVNHIYPVWSAATHKFVDANFPPAAPGENTALLKSYLNDDHVLHYDCDPYYGYPTWFKDVIKDFRDYPEKTDSLIYGLSDAYFNYARRKMVLPDFYDIREYSDTTGMFYAIDPVGYSKLMDTTLYYDNLLINKNPSFGTIVANPKNHYANDCMAAWLDLTYMGFKSYASKYLADNRYPYDAPFLAYAKDMLASCAPNAILFTGGDDDTYPLLSLQLKLHFRTDITIINCNLYAQPDYIKYISAYAPTDIMPDIYRNNSSVDLTEENNENSVPGIESLLAPVIHGNVNAPKGVITLPSNKYSIKTNQSLILTDPSVDAWLKATMVPEIEVTIPNRYLELEDIMILDVIKNNDWKRPVEFANTVNNYIYMGLDKHFVLEGIVYRLFPENNPSNINDSIGLFNPLVNYNLLMNSYQWGGLDKNNSLTDINEERMFENILYTFINAIDYYSANGQNLIADTLFNQAMKVLPPQHLQYARGYINMIKYYYILRVPDKARELAKAITDKEIEKLKRYSSLDPEMKEINKDDAGKSANVIEYLENTVTYYGDIALALDLDKELRKYYNP